MYMISDIFGQILSNMLHYKFGHIIWLKGLVQAAQGLVRTRRSENTRLVFYRKINIEIQKHQIIQSNTFSLIHYIVCFNECKFNGFVSKVTKFNAVMQAYGQKIDRSDGVRNQTLISKIAIFLL